MRSSLGGDEDQGAGAPQRRARPQATRPLRARSAGQCREPSVTHGYLHTPADLRRTGPSIATYVLLSSRSRVRVAVGALIMLVNLKPFY